MGRLQTPSDADVIRSSERDPERFGEIFDRHFVAIYRYLRPRVGPDLAEDLASGALVAAFRRRASYDLRRANARPWLLGIAANLLREHRRTERRRLLAYARVPHDQRVDAGLEAVDERLDADAARRDLARALARLKPAHREVLLLFAWEGLTYQQISEALGIPVGTVRSRLARARWRIRELLARNGQSFIGGYELEEEGNG
jgi:RNA polymerase sigma factor (sigma-70 family)